MKVNCININKVQITNLGAFVLGVITLLINTLAVFQYIVHSHPTQIQSSNLPLNIVGLFIGPFIMYCNTKITKGTVTPSITIETHYD